MSSDKVLVFSVATNGYRFQFRRHLSSHRDYAWRHGYHYVLFDRPRRGLSAYDSAWSKIALTLAAFDRGYDWVFFVDADCEFTAIAPPVLTIVKPSKTLYMALGPSGRVNSGVFLVRNDPTMRELFTTMLGTNIEIPEEDQALYENGHMIHFTRGKPYLQVLDNRWNDWGFRDGKEYIRHDGGSSRKKPARYLRKLLTILSMETYHPIEGDLCARMNDLVRFLLSRFEF